MTRDETVALFLECEAKRKDALALGKTEEEAHKAAREHWNDWAKQMLMELKASRRAVFGQHLRVPSMSRSQWRTKHSKQIVEWLDKARADFSRLEIVAGSYSLRNRDEDDEEKLATEEWMRRLKCTGFWIDFRGFIFPAEADFTDTKFIGLAAFDHAEFRGPVWFRGLEAGDMRFHNVTFHEDVWFRGAVLKDHVGFMNTRFERDADFEAANVRQGFNLGNAAFNSVPNFIQAHFEEAPHLDNVTVGRKGGWSRSRSFSGRWRALKRLAIQGHDTDRELEFFAEEVKSARLVSDWPLPWPFWKAAAWGGFLRFWAGLLYQVLSNFGRSLLRPFVAWGLCMVIFAAFFLGQSPEMAELRRKLPHEGFLRQVSTYSTTAWKAASGKLPASCVSRSLPSGDLEKDSQYGVTGLAEPIRSQTNLANEALSIAYHNAVILLDTSGDSAHRAFGCLYGVERYGGNPVAYVPRSVAIASGIQKLLSAVFIFLFGLAVRNMLKVK
jgi:hypothetical protein